MKFLPNSFTAKVLPCFALFLSFGLSAQISFSNQTTLLTSPNHRSGVAIAVADMNGDGLDDIIRLSQGRDISIAYQTAPGAAFANLLVGNDGGNDRQWGICIGDIDNNSYADILTGGAYDDVKVYRSANDGSQYVMAKLPQSNIFTQGVNFADVNNDGWLDAFVCHDDGTARIFGNNGDGTFSFQPDWIDLTTEPFSDNSGNYGSVWSDIDNDGDLDLYIAKCRQGVNDPTDPRRINQLFLNNGDGTYTQDINDVAGLRIGAQSWTADFGDIDNDGDFDCFVTNHDVSSQLLENDGTGKFTDISASAGLQDVVQGLAIQGVFADLDNDGWVDILVAGTDDYLFKNNGDKTFTSVENAFGADQMESYAIGDLDNDGYVDVYAGYAQTFNNPSNIPDKLWINNGAGKNHIGFRLRGVQSNRDGVGAKIRVFTAAGTQVREVRSGQSYGISNSLTVHFGIDTLSKIDSVVIFWPSGVIDRLYDPAINQYLTVNEGGCVANAISVTAAGPTTFCSGQSLTLDAPAGFVSYLWSNGDTTQSTSVATQGQFKVVVTDSTGCTTTSAPVVTIVDPVEIPTLTAASDTTFCAGGSVTLSSSPAAAYLWSNGATTQNIVATESGLYTVSAQGLCEAFDSKSIEIKALDNPTPQPLGDTVAVGSTATLVANAPNPQWYANPGDLTPAYQQNEYVITNATQSDTFWVSNVTNYDSPNQKVGMVDHQGGTFSDNSYKGGLIFDAFQPFTLAKTKVYTNIAGLRKIELRAADGTLLDDVSVVIPSGTTVIDLGLEVPAGTNMLLTTDAVTNQATLGTDGPQLRRSNMSVDFPYTIDGIVSIKTTTFDTTRYYYFFDWEVDPKGYTCESPRLPVVLFVDSTLVGTLTPAWAEELRLFPNPTSELLRVEMPDFSGGNVLFRVLNAQGATVQTHVMSAPAGSLQHSVVVRDWPSGAYWLEIDLENKGVLRRKFVKN
jgi:hypothetical protein